jgi:uncharacterized protein YaiI (UPF0178 family)
MRIWIDGDACPRAVRTIVFRAAERVQVEAVLVANQDIQVPRSRWARTVRVGAGFDVADHHILTASAPGDVVITQDIPLAAELVAKGVHAISTRGETFTEDNVTERLAVRDLLQGLRDLGQVTGGPPPFSDVDKRTLASALDRLLTAARG